MTQSVRFLRGAVLFGCVAACLGAAARLHADPAPFKRGDVNADGDVDIGDPIYLLNYFFTGGPPPRSCMPVANANGQGKLDISDAITLLSYLFVGDTVIPPLTEQEIADCEKPPPPTVVRQGTLADVADPGHGISGKVEELSDHTIRITGFFYDGTGTPRVVIHLTKNTGFDNFGPVISPDLIRDHPYVNETLQYPFPADLTDDDFKYVAVWCDDFPLTYAFARMFLATP